MNKIKKKAQIIMYMLIIYILVGITIYLIKDSLNDLPRLGIVVNRLSNLYPIMKYYDKVV